MSKILKLRTSEIDREYSMDKRDVKCMQNFGLNIGKEETTWKAYMKWVTLEWIFRNVWTVFTRLRLGASGSPI